MFVFAGFVVGFEMASSRVGKAKGMGAPLGQSRAGRSGQIRDPIEVGRLL